VEGVRVKLALFNTTEKEDLTLFAEDFPSAFEEEEEGEGEGKEEGQQGESLEVNEELFAGEEEDLDDLDDEA
jgi:hypothetical protein